MRAGSCRRGRQCIVWMHSARNKGSRMELEIKCFATLASYEPRGDAAAGVKEGMLAGMPENATVAEVMESLGLPVDDVKIIFVNGIHAEPQTALKNGDRVGFFPAVGGG